MKLRSCIPAAALIAAFVITAADAGAIPLFARKYNAPCSMCHTGDFKLNDFGAAFDQNGYQLPGTIERTPMWSGTSTPFSLLLQDRVSSMHTSFKNSSAPDSSGQLFNALAATIVAGGVIAPHVSLMAEIDFENTGTAELPAGLEYAFVTFNNIFSTDRGQSNIRLGKMRFEGLIEQTPEFYQSKYQIYQYPILVSSGRPQSFWLSFAQYATSLNVPLSFIPGAPQLMVAYGAGDVGDLNLSAAHMLYSRLSTDFDVATVPVTLGLTGIYGEQTQDPSQHVALNNIARDYGLDFEIQQPKGGPVSLYGHLMQFNSTNVLANAGLDHPQDAMGGFIELNGVVVPERVTLQARYDFLTTNLHSHDPAGGALYLSNATTLAQYALIARYHFLPNVHVFFEGSLQSTETFQYNPDGSGSSSTRSALLLSGGFFLAL